MCDDLIERTRLTAKILRWMEAAALAAIVEEAADALEALRAEVERANSWNERVSVCRDHVDDIVDGICVICALDAAEARADKLADALREYGLPLTGDDKRDEWEFGYEAFAREKRRRAALEQESVMGKSISECKQARSHDELIAELLDSRVPKTEREHAAAREIERLRAEVDRLTLEMDHLQQQYDERTACMIVHRGSAIACSEAVLSAYLDERWRADRLSELLDQAYGYVPSGTLADQIHCALTKGYENDV